MTEEPSLRIAPRRFSRPRLAFFRAVELAAKALGGRRFYRARYLAPGRFTTREELVRVAAAEAAGYRIAVLSDFHAGSFLGRGDLRHLVDAALAFAPDAVALLGDFVVHGADEMLPIVPDLARLAAPDGVFAVLGNHDYRGRREGEIEAALAAIGVRMLRNAGARIAERRIVLTGIEDVEEARALDLAAARSLVRPGDVEVALAHNPRAALAFERCGARLVLSGHTHGTQLDLGLLRRLGPPHPGLRVELGATTLLVTRGVGVVGAPLRIGARAELLCVQLVA